MSEAYGLAGRKVAAVCLSRRRTHARNQVPLQVQKSVPLRKNASEKMPPQWIVTTLSLDTIVGVRAVFASEQINVNGLPRDCSLIVQMTLFIFEIDLNSTFRRRIRDFAFRH